jgi:hypothetical protein
MKILVDEHFPEAVADAVQRKVPGFDISTVHAREFDGLPDPALLEILDDEKTTLVTRDVNSIPSHAARRLSAAQTHGGIIYVGRSIRQTNLRVVIRRLMGLIRKKGGEEWQCREEWL